MGKGEGEQDAQVSEARAGVEDYEHQNIKQTKQTKTRRYSSWRRNLGIISTWVGVWIPQEQRALCREKQKGPTWTPISRTDEIGQTEERGGCTARKKSRGLWDHRISGMRLLGRESESGKKGKLITGCSHWKVTHGLVGEPTL